MTVQTNVTKMYADIINKAFPAGHPYLRKLFNKNNMGISYSTTQNMGAIISGHNKKILRQYEKKNTLEPGCNCNDKDNCPLERKCLQEEIVYQAEANAADGEVKYYTGLTEPDFKKRFGNHKKSFEHLRYSHETTLSSYVWEKRMPVWTVTLNGKFSKRLGPTTPHQPNVISVCQKKWRF